MAGVCGGVNLNWDLGDFVGILGISGWLVWCIAVRERG